MQDLRTYVRQRTYIRRNNNFPDISIFITTTAPGEVGMYTLIVVGVEAYGKTVSRNNNSFHDTYVYVYFHCCPGSGRHVYAPFGGVLECLGPVLADNRVAIGFWNCGS